MTRERAKELLPIIQAYSEGKAVQYRVSTNDKWTDLSMGGTLDFDHYDEHEFRIKPEPREFWLNKYNEGVSYNQIYLYPTLEEAVRNKTNGRGQVVARVETIHVREVLD